MATQPNKATTVPTGNPVKVDVTAFINPITRKVDFKDEWEASWKNGPQNGPIEVPYKTPPTEIHFHLRDDTGLHLKFYADCGDAMYISTGSTCPPPKGNEGGQITYISSSNNLLKVSNSNGNKCDLKYALRFEGRDNTEGGERPPYVYDPDLKNGGGGNRSSSTLALVIAGAGVACVAYVAYLAFYK